jgi:hypothetical protein
VPANPSATIDGVGTVSTSIYRADIHGSVDGVKAGSHTLIRDTYIHDMSWFPSDPTRAAVRPTTTGSNRSGGDSGMTLRHNTIDLSSNSQVNAALQSSATDVHVEDNLLDGGACILDFDHTSIGRPLTGIYVVGDRFGPNRLRLPDPGQHADHAQPEQRQRLGRHRRADPARTAARLSAGDGRARRAVLTASPWRPHEGPATCELSFPAARVGRRLRCACATPCRPAPRAPPGGRC